MNRSLVLLLILSWGCEPSEPVTSSPPAPEPSAAQIDEQAHAEQGGLSLSTRRVSEEGWSGRLVVARLEANARRRVRVLPSEGPRPLSEIVAAQAPPQPFVAINGGFYDTHGEAMGLVRAGGVDVHPVGERGGSGVFYVERGVAHVTHVEAWQAAPDAREALQSIDRLVSRGQSVVGAGASDRRAARSAIGVARDGALLLAVAFADEAVASEDEAQITLGPDSTRTGPTIAQWAELLGREAESGGVGALDALGLDGGYSTSLVVKSDAAALSVVAMHATINGVLVSYAD